MRTGSEEEEGGDRDCKAHTVRERERRDRPRRRVQKRKGEKGRKEDVDAAFRPRPQRERNEVGAVFAKFSPFQASPNIFKTL